MNTRAASVTAFPSAPVNVADSMRCPAAAFRTTTDANTSCRRTVMDLCSASSCSNTSKFTFGSANVP